MSDRPASWYAELYARDGLKGGHVIKLGPGNDAAADSALAAFPGGLQSAEGSMQTTPGHGWKPARPT